MNCTEQVPVLIKNLPVNSRPEAGWSTECVCCSRFQSLWGLHPGAPVSIQIWFHLAIALSVSAVGQVRFPPPPSHREVWWTPSGGSDSPHLAMATLSRPKDPKHLHTGACWLLLWSSIILCVCVCVCACACVRACCVCE